MIKLSARDAGKAWDKYVAVCDAIFGAPNHRLAALSSDLETPPAQMPVAAKLLLSAAYTAGELARIQPIFMEWLKYVPRFVDNPSQVTSLNALWERRLRGEDTPSDESRFLDEFLRRTNSDGVRLIADCEAFLRKVHDTIAKDDRLFFHKTCILLGLDYDEPNPPLGRTIMKVLFPSFT